MYLTDSAKKKHSYFPLTLCKSCNEGSNLSGPDSGSMSTALLRLCNVLLPSQIRKGASSLSSALRRTLLWYTNNVYAMFALASASVALTMSGSSCSGKLRCSVGEVPSFTPNTTLRSPSVMVAWLTTWGSCVGETFEASRASEPTKAS